MEKGMADKGKRIRRKPQPERWLVQAQAVLNAPVVPVALRSEAEEDAWWAEQAAEMGLTLAQYDDMCGLGAAGAGTALDP
jgi:hypothetical protein